MALIRQLNRLELERHAPHDEVDCTYSLMRDNEGITSLQLDTYGSNGRKMLGKKSQSLRLAPEAIKQLKRILAEHF